MNLIEELQRLDWNNPGKLSPGGRALLAGLILCGIGALTYFLVIKGMLEDRDSRAAQEASLRADFEKKQADAARLPGLKQQLEDMRTMLQEMVRQLPNRTQMADILVDISQEALATGLQTDRFEPQSEIQKGFYAEKPILLRMVGNYHQFGQFVSGVAGLPRVVILTMHDVALTPVPAGGANQPKVPPGTLVLQGTVKTYRYIEPTDSTTAAPASPRSGGR
jgi:type IV pilus assembly protein PilO